MKKAVLMGAVLAVSSLWAVSDAEVLKLFEQFKANGLEVKIASRAKLDDAPFEQIIVELSDGKRSQKTAIFADDKYIFSNIIEPKSGKSYLAEFDLANEKAQMSGAYKKLAGVLNALPKDKIIELSGDGDANKPVKYLFTDPLCPYCRLELENMEEILKQNRLKVVMAPITSHGTEAVKKSIKIEQEAKSAKTDAEKIAILRKYYDPKAPEPQISLDEVRAARKIIDGIFDTGAIRGVPAYVSQSDLQ